ncbi:MAG: IS1-like element transposase [Planctomycetota bacterium]
MATIEVSCPQCHGFRVRKQGTTAQGKQRFLCQNDCCSRSFILDYSNQAYRPGVKEQITQRALNGSGIRDTARVLKISTSTVIAELKKKHRS